MLGTSWLPVFQKHVSLVRETLPIRWRSNILN
jgi:hypothetical protein